MRNIQIYNVCRRCNFGPTKYVEYNLNSDLNKIIEWLKINQLLLNVKKSKYIIPKLGNKQVNNLLHKIYETVIERVVLFYLLGVTFREKLSRDINIFQVNVPN